MDSLIKPPTAKQLKNETALKVYCAFLCTLILLVVMARRLHVLFQKTWPESSRSQGPQNFFRGRCLPVFRLLRKRAKNLRWVDKPAWGLVVLVGIYLAGNIILSPTILALYRVNHFASRFGWLAAANMALCVFLGMKNTPLGILASTSHTHINRLHRIVGYTTVFLVAIHAAFYTVHFARNGKLRSLLKFEDLAGIGAGTCMLISLMGFFRNRNYEVFYASHIAGFVFTLLLTALHRPDWAKKLPIVMSFIGCLWAIDRLIRASRFTYNLINNQVAMYPLPGGATRLLLRKPSLEFARPGSHCFLWIPQISIYQNHPFTIVSNDHNGLELVMKRCEGFTKRVNDLALQNPGRVAWVSIDGPYSSLPDITVYDKLVLVAGGSGGAFTFGLMNYYFSCPKRTLVQSIEFIWAVKSAEHLEWFARHLRQITDYGSSVKTTIYITSEETTLCDDSELDFIPDDTQGGLQTISQQMIGPDDGTQEYNGSDILGFENDIKAITKKANIIYGKLCTTAMIQDAMQTVRSQDRVLVVACGPASLTTDLRDSVDGYESHFGSTIDMYCEDFSS